LVVNEDGTSQLSIPIDIRVSVHSDVHNESESSEIIYHTTTRPGERLSVEFEASTNVYADPISHDSEKLYDPQNMETHIIAKDDVVFGEGCVAETSLRIRYYPALCSSNSSNSSSSREPYYVSIPTPTLQRCCLGGHACCDVVKSLPSAAGRPPSLVLLSVPTGRLQDKWLVDVTTGLFVVISAGALLYLILIKKGSGY
jgi:hypothetical protein